MKFEISRAEMLASAKMAARVAPLNAPVDVLNGILVECRDDGVFLTATNLESSIQLKMKASIEETAKCLCIRVSCRGCWRCCQERLSLSRPYAPLHELERLQ